jgi:hypothetical protein
MYSYTVGNPNEEIYVKDERVIGGCAIGIILSDNLYFPNIPGDVANANTFDFPVHYELMEGLKKGTVQQVLTTKPSSRVRDALINAGKKLQKQGCRAISSDCGYYANYQNEVAAALDIPVFLSSLLQVPVILRTLKPSQKLAVICARGSTLTEAPALRNVGVNDMSRIVIAGISDAEGTTPPNLRQIQNVFKSRKHMNPRLFEEEMVDIAKRLVSGNEDIGAMLLEGSIFPAFAYGIQKAVRLPIFDFSTLIKWAFSAVVRRPFAGFV